MERLISGAAQMGVNLTPAQVAAFQTYSDELLAWNQQFNLTAVTEPEQVETRHFLDSSRSSRRWPHRKASRTGAALP